MYKYKTWIIVILSLIFSVIVVIYDVSAIKGIVIILGIVNLSEHIYDLLLNLHKLLKIWMH